MFCNLLGFRKQRLKRILQLWTSFAIRWIFRPIWRNRLKRSWSIIQLITLLFGSRRLTFSMNCRWIWNTRLSWISITRPYFTFSFSTSVKIGNSWWKSLLFWDPIWSDKDKLCGINMSLLMQVKNTENLVYFISEGRVQMVVDKKDIFNKLDPNLIKNKNLAI